MVRLPGWSIVQTGPQPHQHDFMSTRIVLLSYYVTTYPSDEGGAAIEEEILSAQAAAFTWQASRHCMCWSLAGLLFLRLGPAPERVNLSRNWAPTDSSSSSPPSMFSQFAALPCPALPRLACGRTDLSFPTLLRLHPKSRRHKTAPLL